MTITIVVKFAASTAKVYVPRDASQEDVIRIIAHEFGFKSKHISVVVNNFVLQHSDAEFRCNKRKISAMVFLSSEYEASVRKLRMESCKISDLREDLDDVKANNVLTGTNSDSRTKLIYLEDRATNILLSLDAIEVSGGLRGLRKIHVEQVLAIANEIDKLIKAV